MDVVFFGDGIWATNCLKKLVSDKHRILAVVVRVHPSDTSLGDYAAQAGFPVLSPQAVNASDFVEKVRAMHPALNISMSYDQILQSSILKTAPLGFINCHAGKLPYYRGRNVINWAIINNEEEIGLTVHYIDQGIDTGDIILQRTISVTWEDTYGTILPKIQSGFPDLLADAVKQIERGTVSPIRQAHLPGTYFCARKDGDEWINWADTSLNIYNKIRAITHPGPGARTLLDGQPLVLWQAKYDRAWPRYLATPGEVVGRKPAQGVVVKTGDSTILLTRVQLPGRAESLPDFKLATRFDVNSKVPSSKDKL